MRTLWILCVLGSGACRNDLLGFHNEWSAWHTEVLVSDARTGLVEARVREMRGWPDTMYEYRILGKRPRVWLSALLLEGSTEDWKDEHWTRVLKDGTSEVGAYDRSCVPDGDHFTCTAIEPGLHL